MEFRGRSSFNGKIHLILCKLGVPLATACKAENCRRGCWWTSNTVAVKMAMTKERLIRFGFYDLAEAYQSVHATY